MATKLLLGVIKYLWNVSPGMVTDITTRCSTKTFTPKPYVRKKVKLSLDSLGSLLATTWRVAMYIYLLTGIGRFLLTSIVLATDEKLSKFLVHHLYEKSFLLQ